LIAGVDGCRQGWIVALAQDWPASAPPRFHLARDFAEVLEIASDCAAVAVDMPIGLPEDGRRRDCDREARALLACWGRGVSGAASRVFDVAPRAVAELAARPGTDFALFNAAHKAATGKGISRQAFAITPKILELDSALTPELQRRVVEAHPELAFAHLAGGRTLASKHSPLGILERCGLLGLDAAGLAAVLADNALPASAQEDLIDAWALLWPAAHVASLADPATPNTRRMPEIPPRDGRGLRMEIWF